MPYANKFISLSPITCSNCPSYMKPYRSWAAPSKVLGWCVAWSVFLKCSFVVEGVEPQETRVDSGSVEQCPPQLGLKGGKGQLVWETLKLSCVKLLWLFYWLSSAQQRVASIIIATVFSLECLALSGMPRRIASSAVGGWPWWTLLVLAKIGLKGLCHSFLATLSAFSNVVSDCTCSLPGSRSVSLAEQQQQSRLASFFLI